MRNEREYYDPRKKTGWPMILVPQDVGGISGEHVDWEPLPEDPQQPAQALLIASTQAEIEAVTQ